MNGRISQTHPNTAIEHAECNHDIFQTKSVQKLHENRTIVQNLFSLFSLFFLRENSKSTFGKTRNHQIADRMHVDILLFSQKPNGSQSVNAFGHKWNTARALCNRCHSHQFAAERCDAQRKCDSKNKHNILQFLRCLRHSAPSHVQNG